MSSQVLGSDYVTTDKSLTLFCILVFLTLQALPNNDDFLGNVKWLQNFLLLTLRKNMVVFSIFNFIIFIASRIQDFKNAIIYMAYIITIIIWMHDYMWIFPYLYALFLCTGTGSQSSAHLNICRLISIEAKSKSLAECM